jgi:hypothetical protein
VDEPELAAYLKIAIGVLHVRARVSALLTKRLPQTKFLLDVKPPTKIAASSRQSLGRALDWVVLKRSVCVCVWKEGERMREWGSATQLIRPNRAAPGLAGRGWPRPTWLPPPTRHELVEASPRRKEGGGRGLGRSASLYISSEPVSRVSDAIYAATLIRDDLMMGE